MRDLILSDSGDAVLVLEQTDHDTTLAVSAEGKWEIRVVSTGDFSQLVRPKPLIAVHAFKITKEGNAFRTVEDPNIRVTFEDDTLTSVEKL